MSQYIFSLLSYIMISGLLRMALWGKICIKSLYNSFSFLWSITFRLLLYYCLNIFHHYRWYFLFLHLYSFLKMFFSFSFIWLTTFCRIRGQASWVFGHRYRLNSEECGLVGEWLRVSSPWLGSLKCPASIVGRSFPTDTSFQGLVGGGSRCRLLGYR